MRYIGPTEGQIEEMLRTIGVDSFEDLIKSIPPGARLQGKLKIPGPLSENKLREKLYRLAGENLNPLISKPLVGAGAYRHHVPAVIPALLQRGEFLTSYTPYQPELSQGTLQAIFELQSYLARLTGMGVVIPSIYDGASATAEAVLMALRIRRENKIIVSATLHPHYRQAVETYCAPHGTEIVELPYRDGWADRAALEEVLDDEVAAVILQSPNFFGGIEKIEDLSELVHTRNALLIQVITESLSLGILKEPGQTGVDIVAGEAQSLGMDLSFGGPYNGYLASRKKFIRQLPGRIVGETVDKDGRRAFVMTSRAREQDIRREKATSNICTSHGLNMIAADIYLSLLGTEGFYQLALLNTRAAHYLEKKLVETGKFERVFDCPFFNEFLLKSEQPVSEVNRRLLEDGFIPPLEVIKFYPDEILKNVLLFAVTEIFSREDLDRVVRIVTAD